MSIPMQQTRPDMVGREWKIRNTRRPDISPFVIVETPPTRTLARKITEEYRKDGYLCEWRDLRRAGWPMDVIIVLINPYPEERLVPRKT